jgi:hypothetical protein
MTKLTKYLLATKSVTCDGTRKESLREKIEKIIKRILKQ